MKIAMLTNNYKPFVGGVPISVERLAKELRKQGHKVTVFAPDYGFDPRYGQVEEDDVIRFQVTRQKMENGMVYPKLVSREIWKGFKEHEFDCIHVHQPMFVGTQALYLGRKYQIPVIYTYHTRYEDYLHYIPFFREEQAGMWRKKLIWFAKETVIPGYMKWFTNKCDLIFAPTPGMQNRIRENGTEVSMAVLPTGLDDSFYIEDEEKTKTIRRQYLGEEKNGHLFCSVSRLEEEKNPIFLLNGIRCLKEKLPFSFRVLLLGEGSMRKELEVLAEQMGLSDTVVFLGNISNEDVKQYLYASELFLFASKSETQGIVLEEAMAAGNPIVAVRASGVEDVVKNGINGYKEIAKDYGMTLIETLTGFKYIGEQIKFFEQKQDYEYVFGYEESYGCLVGTHARDKDAVAAVMALCEVAAYCRHQGITLCDQMENLFQKYGYYQEGLCTVTLKGQEGAKKIQSMMEQIRENIPEKVGGLKVMRFRDYREDIVKDCVTGVQTVTGLPKSNVLYFELENEAWCCIRPSGTEPKIKFYIGVKGTSDADAAEKRKVLTKAVESLAE